MGYKDRVLFDCFFVALLGQAPAFPALIPNPASVQINGGSYVLPVDAIVSAPGNASRSGAVLAERFHFKMAPPRSRSGDIRLQIDGSLPLKAEGYRITIGEDGVELVGKDQSGVAHAVQTFRQLLPPEADGSGLTKPAELPKLIITDQPRFAWRGVLLDVSRHFFTSAEIKRVLDEMALLRLNVLHWHLVDDGGWRIEIKRYPELTRIGSMRTATKDWNQGDLEFPGPGSGKPLYGGFYTQAEIRDVVKYATARGITVMPEIEMPGHTMGSIAAYPNLACPGYDATGFYKKSNNKIANVYCAGSESTYIFLENVLKEVIDLFPSTFIHIGGDEVDPWLWNRCQVCQGLMKRVGLKTESELESYFIRRIEKFLNSKGKRLIGWDEILEGGLAPNASVMSWRGINGGIAAAKSGHDVVMTPTGPCYFDYSYKENSTQRVYDWEPVPADLSAAEAAHVLGGQANLWTERVPDLDTIHLRLYPRLLAMAETLWCDPRTKNWEEFRGRLGRFMPRLDALGMDYVLPQPDAPVSGFFSDQSVEVKFAGQYAGLTMRYTSDGSPVMVDSPRVPDHLTALGPADLRAAFVTASGRAGAETRVVVAQSPVGTAGGKEIGLLRETYRGTWREMPDFAILAPTTAKATLEIGIGSLKGEEDYAVHLTGILEITEDGYYSFKLGSDDGSWMKLMGQKMVDNDGLHGTIYAVSKLFLKKGFYPLEVGFFQAGGDDSLSLEWSPGGAAFAPIPAKLLSHDKT